MPNRCVLEDIISEVFVLAARRLRLEFDRRFLSKYMYLMGN